jgi:hypothetical protein
VDAYDELNAALAAAEEAIRERFRGVRGGVPTSGGCLQWDGRKLIYLAGGFGAGAVLVGEGQPITNASIDERVESVGYLDRLCAALEAEAKGRLERIIAATEGAKAFVERMSPEDK